MSMVFGLGTRFHVCMNKSLKMASFTTNRLWKRWVVGKLNALGRVFFSRWVLQPFLSEKKNTWYLPPLWALTKTNRYIGCLNTAFVVKFAEVLHILSVSARIHPSTIYIANGHCISSNLRYTTELWTQALSAAFRSVRVPDSEIRIWEHKVVFSCVDIPLRSSAHAHQPRKAINWNFLCSVHMHALPK